MYETHDKCLNTAEAKGPVAAQLKGDPVVPLWHSGYREYLEICYSSVHIESQMKLDLLSTKKSSSSKNKVDELSRDSKESGVKFFFSFEFPLST